MGSYSTLRLNRLTIITVKNSILDHSDLFSQNDLKLIDYYYANNYSVQKSGYSRKLQDCRLRLDLLGYDNTVLKSKFESCANEANIVFSYELLIDILRKININSSVYDEVDDDELLNHEEVTVKIRSYIHSNMSLKELDCDETWELLDCIEWNELLSIFVFNDIFINEDLCWEIDDIIENGYIDKSEVSALFTNSKKVMLITEGSTDLKIIQTALDWIYPDLNTFFEFIDMEKNYPFTGTGNIVNFYYGLCKIGPSKKIIFIFDNDTAGNNAKKKCVSENHLNIKHITLPSLPEFSHFKTIGPSGEYYENINGKAVSIELFLDLSFNNQKQPIIRWHSFDEHANQYQGSLINKDSYSKKYFQAYRNKDTNYNLDKLKILLNELFRIVKIA